MTLEHPLIDIADVPPRDDIAEGWDPRAQVRVAVSGREGSSTSAFHAVLPPGGARAPHVNPCDEILIYLAGGGVAEIGGRRAQVRAGHCQFVPKGVAHAFEAGPDGETIIVGFRPFASDLAASTGEVAPSDASGGTLVHLDDVVPARMAAGDGWSITDFRLPIGSHTGSDSTLFRARFSPGAVHKKHRHDACEEIYYIISGSGIAGAGRDRVRVHGGHFHYVPKGVEHWLSARDESEPIEVVGIYIGAGSVEATGYVYMGDVTADDLRLPADSTARGKDGNADA